MWPGRVGGGADPPGGDSRHRGETGWGAEAARLGSVSDREVGRRDAHPHRRVASRNRAGDEPRGVVVNAFDASARIEGPTTVIDLIGLLDRTAGDGPKEGVGGAPAG